MNEKLDIFFKEIRKDFPILKTKVNENNLIYVDNAATTQKPKIMIDKLVDVYSNSYANVHRGIHTLSEISTSNLEKTRENISNFINSKSKDSIIFTKGTTDSLNKISFGIKHLIKKGDEILLSTMEHHANLICWQEIAKQTGAKLKFIDFDENYLLDKEQIKQLISNKTKILSLTHYSNVLGTINNIEEIIGFTNKFDTITIIDAAQSISHEQIDVEKLNVDFLVFSAHKIYGPSGVGVLYMNEKMFNSLEPTEFGGNMIEEVDLENSTYAQSPFKFESGTPNIADIIAFNESLNFFQNIGYEKINEYEKSLTKYFLDKSKELGKEFVIYGPKEFEQRCGVFSFKFADIHPHDLSTLLDQFGIAIRSGHHCAMPLHNKLNISSTSRISLSMYNTKEEIDNIMEALKKIKKMYEEGNFLL